MANVSWRALHAASALIVRRRIALSVSGLACLPETGPVIVAARHYHHLYDGCILLATINRPAHILVGIDWLQHPLGRKIMTRACQLAQWPVIHRPDSPYPGAARDARLMMIRAVRQTLDLLKAGHVIIIFPEAYPNIDPGITLKVSPGEFLSFRAGFARLAHMAARSGLRVPVVPAGFAYDRRDSRWHVDLRLGQPVFVEPEEAAVEGVIQNVENCVKRLSMPGATP